LEAPNAYSNKNVEKGQMYELYNHLVHYFGRALQQDKDEGEKNHKKGGLNCVFGNFFYNVLDNCPQVQSLK